MRRRSRISVFVAFALSACVTTRIHEQSELNSIGQRCGLALGELFQDEEQKKLLFMVRIGSTPEQKSCVAKWARRNVSVSLKLFLLCSISSACTIRALM